MTMPAPLLSLEGVTKRYGALVVADGLDLEVASGEALGVVGPNGAGKSTMFNLISGAVAPDAGHIRFEAQDVTKWPSHLRCRAGMGRSYQIPHPFAKMTVLENLLVGASFGGAVRTEREAVEECVEILHRTGLVDRANLPAGQLSLIERKRLEMARALSTRPKLLLLDEIAGGLTDAECAGLVETIADIRSSGTAIIWIEHVTHALLQIVERLAVLNFGRIVASGEPRETMDSDVVHEIYLGMAA